MCEKFITGVNPAIITENNFHDFVWQMENLIILPDQQIQIKWEDSFYLKPFSNNSDENTKEIHCAYIANDIFEALKNNEK